MEVFLDARKNFWKFSVFYPGKRVLKKKEQKIGVKSERMNMDTGRIYKTVQKNRGRNLGFLKRRWRDSNPRAGCPTNAFRVRPVMTTSIHLRIKELLKVP